MEFMINRNAITVNGVTIIVGDGAKFYCKDENGCLSSFYVEATDCQAYGCARKVRIHKLTKDTSSTSEFIVFGEQRAEVK